MANENLPLINLPKKSGTYKIVQFDSDDRPYLRFGSSIDFHEFILEGFAQEIGVKCTKIPGPGGLVSALPDNASYRMSGAGICSVDIEKRTATFSGDSRDYRIGINQEHLQRLRTEFTEWQIE